MLISEMFEWRHICSIHILLTVCIQGSSALAVLLITSLARLYACLFCDYKRKCRCFTLFQNILSFNAENDNLAFNVPNKFKNTYFEWFYYVGQNDIHEFL